VFDKVVIANRGVIACRIIRTLRRMGIGSVAVFSEADAGSLHVQQADEALCIGPAAASASYLNAAALIETARITGSQAIHPGYGFLSENAQFAEQCAATGVVFIGPTPQNIRAFGLKHTARELARRHGVPLVPGSEVLHDIAEARAAAARLGFPLMLKATAGGGGIGMRACENDAALEEAYAFVTRTARNNFKDGGVYMERLVPEARHVEVQIFGERDCSLQRRNQKVIEETPAPGLSASTRMRMVESAVKLARAVTYTSAGTVEFLFDAHRDEFFFLEVNTRLQVEHGVTEEVTGIDLVEWMVRCAAGDRSFLDDWLRTHPPAHGCSIQARLYAEDPAQENRPSSGTVTELRFPERTRIETWITSGTEVSTHYDPLLAKLIVRGENREAAVRALRQALAATALAGFETNLGWLRQIAGSEMFARAEISTRALGRLPYKPHTVRVLTGGLATTVQDYPGRLGFWHVGVPPSGPMDSLAFRLGNRLLDNPDSAAGLEVTAVGPTLVFDHPTWVCLTGADCDARLDGEPVPPYTPVAISAGQTLKLARVRGPGLRAYVLFHGGLEVPAYLSSRSTFTLGRFGGHAGRNLAAGDVLHLTANIPPEPSQGSLPETLRPSLDRVWRLRVLYGPHGAPEFFTPQDIDTILEASWKVHYNSNRTGVRLVGPKPRWARRDGGEAGLHPSNIHDNAYAVGAMDFTGDMPIILGPDGPSLGGFVCPFVVIHADLWKVGQLTPGDTVQFQCMEEFAAEHAAREQDEFIAGAKFSGAGPTGGAISAATGAINAATSAGSAATGAISAATNAGSPVGRAASPGGGAGSPAHGEAILGLVEARGSRPKTVYRRQGDRHLLVEYGPLVLDLTLRLRVHALMLELERMQLPGVIDITPDSRILGLERLLGVLADSEDRLGELEAFEIPSRVIWLPLSFDDPSVAETIARYMASVRSDAPWCPDNIEFIRRINGLASVEDVRRIVFDARYLVMGLGDVYLGAPVAVPLDPRHRLVTTKYNPARTWTPPNVVGIGGAYMCIYGMEGPGGYQLFGRTIQVWSSYRRTPMFSAEAPWLLRFFDQIRFFPVTHAELNEWRRDFPFGRRSLQIQTEMFRLADYRRFLAEHRAGIEAFQATRQAAFATERDEWVRNQELSRIEGLDTAPVQEIVAVPDGAEVVEAPLGGNVWRIHVRPGDHVEKGSIIAAIEAMKTECGVPSPSAGIVRAVYIQERQSIAPGMPLIALEPAVHRVGGEL
jgi:urea carboxylase